MNKLDKILKKLEHEPDYPVEGGHPMCAKCGKQNYQGKYCYVDNEFDIAFEEQLGL